LSIWRKLGRDVAALDLLLAGGGDDVAGGERLHPEAALQRLGGAVEAQILLGRGEDDALRRLRFDLADGDEIARADLGIGALEAVEADDVEALVLGIGTDRARRGGALAGDLDDVALGQPSSAISRRGSRARPRPLSSGRIVATCSRVGCLSSSAIVAGSLAALAVEIGRDNGPATPRGSESR
jgi:hypothetical protein